MCGVAGQHPDGLMYWNMGVPGKSRGNVTCYTENSVHQGISQRVSSCHNFYTMVPFQGLSYFSKKKQSTSHHGNVLEGFYLRGQRPCLVITSPLPPPLLCASPLCFSASPRRGQISAPVSVDSWESMYSLSVSKIKIKIKQQDIFAFNIQK